MELKQALGNTWYLDDWQLIPLYKLDTHRCILLDSGLYEQRQEIEDTLQSAGLTPVGILGTHAHNDHSSNHHYFQQKYHLPVALPLGEAAVCCTAENLKSLFFMDSMQALLSNERVSHMVVQADRVILPRENEIDFCGAKFGIVHTPGHTVDHICTRTADNVLYLGDAMMTGRTLHHSKFPFAFRVRDYLDSMRKMRSEPADKFIVAHFGVYDEILPLVDMEARFFAERMLDLLDEFGIKATFFVPIDQPTDPKKLTSDICRTYHITATKLSDVSYFESSSLSYLNYLRGLGYLEAYVEDNSIHYRRTPTSYARKEAKRESVLPKTGQFR